MKRYLISWVLGCSCGALLMLLADNFQESETASLSANRLPDESRQQSQNETLVHGAIGDCVTENLGWIVQVKSSEDTRHQQPENPLSQLKSLGLVAEHITPEEAIVLFHDTYFDTTKPLNERIDALMMTRTLEKQSMPPMLTEQIMFDISQLDNEAFGDELAQLIELLPKDLDDYQANQLLEYIETDDPFVQIAVVDKLSYSTSFEQYQDVMFELLHNSPYDAVKEKAYFTLLNRYGMTNSDMQDFSLDD